MNKVLFSISAFGLFGSLLFTIISIWNNGIEWMLLERGYYTFGVLTVAVTMLFATKSIIDRTELKRTTLPDTLMLGLSVIFAVIVVIFMAISIRNTEWVLLEKGYYWMGLFFVSVTAVMFWATLHAVIKEIQPSNQQQ
jgi:uncharacterized membrane protein YiaA